MRFLSGSLFTRLILQGMLYEKGWWAVPTLQDYAQLTVRLKNLYALLIRSLNRSAFPLTFFIPSGMIDQRRARTPSNQNSGVFHHIAHCGGNRSHPCGRGQSANGAEQGVDALGG